MARPQKYPGDPGRSVTVYLPASLEARARELGTGNVSDGIQRAILEHHTWPLYCMDPLTGSVEIVKESP